MSGYAVVYIPETRQAHTFREGTEPWHTMDTDCACQPGVEDVTSLDGQTSLVVSHKDTVQ